MTSFARDQGLRLVLIALGMVIAMRVVRIVLSRVEERLERLRPSDAPPRRLRALFDILSYLGAALVGLIGTMAMLSTLGVNTGALLASAGVAGFALGFGAQTLVKDLLSGLFLLAEGQYTLGDVIQIADVTGKVERVTLWTTTLRAENGDVHIVPSGEIRRVTNRSRGWSQLAVDVPIAGTVSMQQAMGVLERCAASLVDDPDLAPDLIEPPDLLGIEDVRPDHVIVRLTARVRPDRRLVVARLIRRKVFDCFEHEGLQTFMPPTSGPYP